jgi:Cu2+-exporting ATPase
VNDAPVLAQAQVSVAMGGGAQLARTQSDFVLLSENLDHLRFGLQRAQRTSVSFARTCGGRSRTILWRCRWQ